MYHAVVCFVLQLEELRVLLDLLALLVELRGRWELVGLLDQLELLEPLATLGLLDRLGLLVIEA